jgi:hypothetical protein
MRVVYENRESQTAEQQIVAEVIEAWGLEGADKLPISYRMDYAVYHWEVKPPIQVIDWFLEAKSRDWMFGNGDGYRLSLLKAEAAWTLRQVTGLPSILAVRFFGGIIRWTHMNIYRPDIIIAGRRDRNDAADIEPHVVYDWSLFSELDRRPKFIPIAG